MIRYTIERTTAPAPAHHTTAVAFGLSCQLFLQHSIIRVEQFIVIISNPSKNARHVVTKMDVAFNVDVHRLAHGRALGPPAIRDTAVSSSLRSHDRKHATLQVIHRDGSHVTLDSSFDKQLPAGLEMFFICFEVVFIQIAIHLPRTFERVLIVNVRLSYSLPNETFESERINVVGMNRRADATSVEPFESCAKRRIIQDIDAANLCRQRTVATY